MKESSILGLIEGLGRLISAHIPDTEIFNEIVMVNQEPRIYAPPFETDIDATLLSKSYSAYPDIYLDCTEGRSIYWSRKNHLGFDASWRLRSGIRSSD
jgi:hypothetical protein